MAKYYLVRCKLGIRFIDEEHAADIQTFPMNLFQSENE